MHQAYAYEHKKHLQTATMSAADFRTNYVDQVESNLQARCVSWFRLQFPQLFLFAIPNGGQRSKAEAAILIGEGVVSGVPDLCLAYPAGEYHGLYIEMKTRRKDSKPSDKQLAIHALLRSMGYDVAIPKTFEEFQSVIFNYLNHP